MVDKSIERMKKDIEMEKGSKRLLPNWGPCERRGNLCPKIFSDHREAGLVKGICSNNDSIDDCVMYQALNQAIEKYGLMKECYDSLVGSCTGAYAHASEDVKKRVGDFRREIGTVCREVVGESL